MRSVLGSQNSQVFRILPIWYYETVAVTKQSNPAISEYPSETLSPATDEIRKWIVREEHILLSYGYSQKSGGRWGLTVAENEMLDSGLSTLDPRGFETS